MTAKQFASLGRSILPQLPPFAIKGRLMVLLPMEHFLRGINFEPSAFDKTSFSVTSFIMPLFVPSAHLTLNFADRVRRSEGGGGWDANMALLVEQLGDAIRKQAVPRLSSIQSPLDLVNLARETHSQNPHTLRATAFALALDGKSQQAIAVIDDLIQSLDKMSAWQVEIGEMANNLKVMLMKNPEKARQQLLKWEDETIINLKLGDVRDQTPTR
jgi:hypothetical protein